jgi:AraC-like DNA-binding protein
VVPIERARKSIFVLYAGVFRKKGNVLPKELKKELLPLYKKLPVYDENELEELSRILYMFGQGLLYCAEKYRQLASAPVLPDRKKVIRDFIKDNAHKPVSIDDIAHHLCVSSSRARHIVTRLFGNSFQVLLLHERMARARNLLFNSSLTLKEISAKLSYKNVYYFNRVFKKFYGIPPGQFRSNA